MALKLDAKKAVVSEVSAIAAKSHSVVAADYRGLTVGELNDLRVTAKGSGVYLRVIKNTLARRAVESTEFECMKDSLVGPLILAFSMEEPGSAPRVIKDFSKTHKKLEAMSIAIGGQLYGAEELDRLAKLPTREQALSLLMAVMKAPVEKLVRTLAEPVTKLVRTTAAIRDQKQGG